MSKSKVSRKLFATTASAALVASAVVPAAVSAAEVKDLDSVAAYAKDAVKELVDAGVIQGDQNGNFNPTNNIDRASAAEILRKALNLSTEGTEDFTDVKAGDWFYESVVATAKEGIFEGNEKDQFMPKKNLTRQEAAKIIVAAYGLTGDAKLSFDDSDKVAAWAKDAVETAVATGVMNGKPGNKFAPTDNITRAEFAVMIKRAIDAQTLSVTDVKATNAKTLTVSGSALNKLTAEDFTVEGNKVASISADKLGRTATVTLETPLVDGQEYKVSVKVGEETKDFTVKFEFVLADVAITTTTLEANKDKQFLQVTLNGDVTDLATIDSLGYKIEFQANEAVFVDAAGTGQATFSATGEIDETVAETALNKTFDVKAVLTKDGKTAESKTVTVKVVSKATPAIGDILISTSELTLTKPVVSTKDSTVAVAGVESNTGDVIDVSGLTQFASSNPEVATINATTGAITPIKAGKTTITLTAGNVTYSKEITVVAEERVATKATAGVANIAPGALYTANVVITDQFGEKVDVSDITNTKLAVSEVSGVTNATADFANAVDGVLPVTINPAVTAAAGSYTVVVKDLTTLKNLGQFAVRVSADNVADNYKLEVADSSKGVANLAGSGEVVLNAKEFTKSGGFLRTLASGDTDAADFTVESANPTIATVAAPDASGNIVVSGVKVGSTQIILKKDGVQVATATIKVEEVIPTIESITWKANASTITVAGKEVTYKDIFNITETAAGVDAIVEGVKLNVNTTSKVRIDFAGAAPVLYLDSDDNGIQSAGDEVLGELATTLSGSVGENISLGTDWEVNILGAATASGDKGTVVITVTDDDVNNTVRASSTLKVDVK